MRAIDIELKFYMQVGHIQVFQSPTSLLIDRVSLLSSAHQV